MATTKEHHSPTSKQGGAVKKSATTKFVKTKARISAIDIVNPENLKDQQIPEIRNASAVINYIQQHTIGAAYFNYLKRVATLSDDKISHWLHISPKTFNSYRTQEGTISKENTQEHVIMIIGLYKHAELLFDSNEDFSQWLNTPNFFFDKKCPSEFLGTISGIRFIDSRLTAMEYGDNV